MRNHLSGTKAYRVAWFVTREARSDVTVTFDHGRLIRVDSGRTADAIDLGEVALVDGLVNAHTHLEFSDFDQPLPMTGRFTDWIRTVISHRRAHSINTPEAIRAGLRESRQSGTTRIGEISTLGWSWNDYLLNGFRGVIFQEALGLTEERITEPMALALKHIQSVEYRDFVGLSPHAPYSTHLELVDSCVRLCVESGRPLAMHLAETKAELELLSDRSGEFREMLTDFGLWSDDASRFGQRPLDYLQRLALVPRSLVIHGNYLSDDELMYMAAHPGMTLVYCPRTHAAFGHSPHPWRRAIELGVPVALGTDSRASNPDLSPFAELQFLSHNYPDMSQLELLNLGSIAGRIALGDDRPNAGDFTLIRLNDQSAANDEPHLFASVNLVCGTMANGQWTWLAEDFECLIAS